MELNQIKDFTKLLNAASDKRFVVIKNKKFHLVSDKSAKNLNTAQIADIASECFDTLSVSKLESFERRDICRNLANVLGRYSRRVIRSKPWWAKILAFFWIVSKQETRLTQAKKKIERLIRSIESQDSKKVWAHKHAERFIIKEHQKPMNQLKRFYAKVLETSSYRQENFEGYNQSAALYTYLEDLKKYQEKLVSERKPVPKNLPIIIKELDAAYRVILHERVMLDSGTKKSVKESVIDDIRKQIKQLPLPKDDDKRSVFIPGGCEKHGIMYKVEKELNGTYSFTVVNTGSGADFNYLSSAWTLLVNDRLTVQDVKYINLTADQLSRSFLSELLDIKREKNMDIVNSKVEKALLKHGQVKQVYARKHKAQTKGTCAFKNVSSVIHEKLGEDYNGLKVFITSHEINNLMGINVSKGEKTKMLSEGQKILKHRMSKI